MLFPTSRYTLHPLFHGLATCNIFFRNFIIPLIYPPTFNLVPLSLILYSLTPTASRLTTYGLGYLNNLTNPQGLPFTISHLLFFSLSIDKIVILFDNLVGKEYKVLKNNPEVLK